MLVPLRETVIVKKLETKEEKSASGLVLTTMVDDKNVKGLVVAVGDSSRLYEEVVLTGKAKVGDSVVDVVSPIQVDDVVLFPKNQGVEVRDDGQLFFVVEMTRLICKVK